MTSVDKMKTVFYIEVIIAGYILYSYTPLETAALILLYVGFIALGWQVGKALANRRIK